jgi:hypothetical protein
MWGRDRLAQVAENFTYHWAFVDEGDDSHVTAALGANER